MKQYERERQQKKYFRTQRIQSNKEKKEELILYEENAEYIIQHKKIFPSNRATTKKKKDEPKFTLSQNCWDK